MVQFRARKSNEPFPRTQGDNYSAIDSVTGSDLGTAPLPRSRPRPATTRDLADEINGLAASLEEIDSRSTERLRDLASSLSTEEGRLRWADPPSPTDAVTAGPARHSAARRPRRGPPPA